MIPEQDLAIYLQPTAIVDSDHAAVQGFAQRHTAGCSNDRERAVALYYAVRDGIRYNPYGAGLVPEQMRASAVLARGEHFCVPKAVLLCAACRASGMPARLGFADVRNHLASRRLRDLMGTDLFVFHGYTEIWLHGRWVKVTPTFNLELCQKFNVKPLEFDGQNDALFHTFDNTGSRHMEYVRYRGEFADVPLDLMRQAFMETYGNRFSGQPFVGNLADEAPVVS